jgi:hypothetical protein
MAETIGNHRLAHKYLHRKMDKATQAEKSFCKKKPPALRTAFGWSGAV